MPYLLDTCTFLWAADDPEKLGRGARKVLEDESAVYASAVSAWEIQVKYGTGKLDLRRPPRAWWTSELERLGFMALPLEASAVFLLGALGEFHRDPFDRMLICQALYHGLVLLTPDPLIQEYPVPVIW